MGRSLARGWVGLKAGNEQKQSFFYAALAPVETIKKALPTRPSARFKPKTASVTILAWTDISP
jgi:hypothetical protein